MHSETISALAGQVGPIFRDITGWDNMVLVVKSGTILAPVWNNIRSTKSYHEATNDYTTLKKEHRACKGSQIAVIWIAKRREASDTMWILIRGSGDEEKEE